ncbi:hypothetical protein VB711_24260 [Cronbergia sp. UHCC 0137]|uniref:PFE-CTERM domain-containing protein n=1 Tax=Cronbergia sp. UHCC 0137 TaxID=3110239 RepID=UPI002B208064|nr:hypothetical protein [Cronbergia sp. UHCC 0137]MEA5620927.1 hypothetical protein [Cronbergia sp. UHCC 0137]
MKLATRLGIATVGIALTMTLTEIKPAQALLWNWSFNSGAEVGTFETNGTFADTAGAFNFTIDVTKFDVTASAFEPSLVGATFTDIQPTQGFLWNGTTATQFYRGSGGLTNGSNFLSTPYRVTFGVSGSPVGQTSNESTLADNGFTALTLTPSAATPVPFEFSPNLGLGLIGAYAVGKIALKKIKPSKTLIKA